ncbi:MAG: TetR/AcrR family transcriptional regulator [Caulobacteraceae bacterium]|nr:TetR/AcrR family transcriptional regulator [Caulobacteraceae bacterium]
MPDVKKAPARQPATQDAASSRVQETPAGATQRSASRPRVSTNQHGQTMGPKGLLTRRRLVEATEALLHAKPLRDIRVSDIAQNAKTSAATFYLYFADVNAAVLAVIEDISERAPDWSKHFTTPWTPQDSYARSRAFVLEYVGYLRANAAPLRVRNLAADEGDPDFLRVRGKSAVKIFALLIPIIEERQAAGAVPKHLHSLSAVIALLAMFERIGTIPLRGLANVSYDQMLDTAAFLTVDLLGDTGRPRTF